jgi:hypothetical protein
MMSNNAGAGAFPGEPSTSPGRMETLQRLLPFSSLLNARVLPAFNRPLWGNIFTAANQPIDPHVLPAWRMGVVATDPASSAPAAQPAPVTQRSKPRTGRRQSSLEWQTMNKQSQNKRREREKELWNELDILVPDKGRRGADPACKAGRRADGQFSAQEAQEARGDAQFQP